MRRLIEADRALRLAQERSAIPADSSLSWPLRPRAHQKPEDGEPRLVARSGPRACALAAELGIVPGNEAMLDGDLRDQRVGAVVSLDLGLARGFTRESLAETHVPMLVIGAGVDIGGLSARLESGHLAANLPPATSRYVEIPDAMHFSFTQPCKPGAIALIEEEEPGDGIVCEDGGTRGRNAIHGEVAAMIIAFLAGAIPLN